MSDLPHVELFHFTFFKTRRLCDSCHENSIPLKTRMIKKCLNFQINFHVLHFSPETLILSRAGNKSLWLHKRNETSVFSPNYRKVTHHHHYSSQRKTEGQKSLKNQVLFWDTTENSWQGRTVFLKPGRAENCTYKTVPSRRLTWNQQGHTKHGSPRCPSFLTVTL